MRTLGIKTSASLIITVILLLIAALASNTKVDISKILYTYRSHIIFLVFYSIFAVTIFIARKDIVNMLIKLLKNFFILPEGEEKSGLNIKSFILFITLMLVLISLLNPYMQRNLVERINPQKQYLGNISQVQEENVENSLNSPNNPTPLPSHSQDHYMLLIMSIWTLVSTLVIMVSVILVVKGVVDYLRSSELLEEEQESVLKKSLKKELSRQLDKTISRLELENIEDVRKAIVELYMCMCELFAKHGVKMEKNMTAREFMAKLRGIFRNIPENALEDLTHIFEKAVYSNYPITLEDRDAALRALKTIREYLGEFNEGT